MLLTLQTATIENGGYTWRFPKLKFSMCIKTYDVGIPISYNYIYKGMDKEISQLLIPPNFCPCDFEDEYFSIIFVKSPVDITPLFPNELTIELTPCN